MLHVLNWVYSWQAFFGGVAGLALQRLYRYMEAEYGNRHHPLPDGRRYYSEGISRVWIAGLVATLTIGYVLMSAEQARVDASGTNARIVACVSEFQDALTRRSDITAQDADLSNQVSDLRSQQDDALGLMMSRILNPPPDIAKLDPDDPRRVAWKTDVQFIWSDWTGKLRTQIGDLTVQRKQLAAERAKHPIPDLKC